MNKRSRVDEIDDDSENGEQSEFFKNKSRRTRAKPSPQAISTPSRKVNKEGMQQVAEGSTPTPLVNDAQTPDGSAEKVTQGWKSIYGFGGSSTQSGAKLSDIIKKHSTSSQPKVMTPLQRLSALRRTTNPTFKTPSRTSTTPRIESFISDGKENEPSTPTVRPMERSFGNETESSQEDWPEFVGVDKYNRSSQSIGQQSDVRGIFSKFAFQG